MSIRLSSTNDQVLSVECRVLNGELNVTSCELQVKGKRNNGILE
jgi:hypothetical protein